MNACHPFPLTYYEMGVEEFLQPKKESDASIGETVKPFLCDPLQCGGKVTTASGIVCILYVNLSLGHI